MKSLEVTKIENELYEMIRKNSGEVRYRIKILLYAAALNLKEPTNTSMETHFDAVYRH